MIINSIFHHFPEYKLSFELDHFKRSQWNIKDEQGEIVAVADIPVKLFRRFSLSIYDGKNGSLLCEINDPKDSPLSVKDGFYAEFHDGGSGKIIFDSRIGYERYYSNLGIELRVAGSRKTFYRNGEVIAKCKENSLNEKTTIVYWDKQYLTQIIVLFFTHVLKDFKEYHS